MGNSTKELEAGAYVKSMYLLGLAIIILSFLGKVPYALKLLSQMGGNPNIINPVLAIVLIAVALIVLIFLGGRFLNIARGKIKLDAFIYGKSTVYLRVFGMVLLSLGVVVTVLVFGSMFIVRGGGQMLIARSFSFAIPLGLVLFELSRLSGFENKYINNDA
ncbi:hypothetical protein [Thiohalophilus sp.]|uniref:hypothetical protein n=1 Tax=Thiohalophilus sp. TaxID=3028392 RepID=UPI002ACDE732|nr:hypothetical protein [Thiohalophilus sp.]MDZ7803160.1 hypothetical protein [Thiohalophilus sp.]